MRLIGRKKSWIRVVNGGAGHKSRYIGMQRATSLANPRALGKFHGARRESTDGPVTYQERWRP